MCNFWRLFPEKKIKTWDIINYNNIKSYGLFSYNLIESVIFGVFECDFTPFNSVLK